MKTINELESMLVDEINNNILSLPYENAYYLNEFLGDTSFIIAKIMELNLMTIINFREQKLWFDDTLIIKLEKDNEKVSIWGILIFGVEDTTEQFTNPFRFIINLSTTKSFFYYSDLTTNPISYEKFISNRDYWSPIERDWEYIIK